MCRVDGDCQWYVDTETDQVAAVELTCEDCWRKIAPGETYVRFTCIPGDDYDGDEPMYIWIAQLEIDCASGEYGNGFKYQHVDMDKPHHRIDEESEEIWEHYGFIVDEMENPDIEMPDHISCKQCRVANRWLEVICHQHTVMVTKEDLNEHWREYDEETLGESFKMLVESVNRAWRRSMGISLLTPEWVADHTNQAIDHAIAHGMQEAVH